MSCLECKCNRCANSVELSCEYFTPGEGDFPCFTCDECKHFDGDWSKRTKWRRDCDKYKLPARKIELQREAAEREAARRRRQIRLLHPWRDEKT